MVNCPLVGRWAKYTLLVGCSPTATWLIGFFGSSLALVYAYNASNISGHTKKVTVNAMTLATFGLGNIVGTEIFLPKDSPTYIPGKISIMVLLSVQLFVCLLLRFVNYRMNAEKVRVVEEMKVSNGWTDEDVQKEREKHAFLDMTDKQYVDFFCLCREDGLS